MYLIFKDYEEINEVIIPRKNDIRGKIYGFVKFYKVQDEKVMSTKPPFRRNYVFIRIKRGRRTSYLGGGGERLVGNMVQGD